MPSQRKEMKIESEGGKSVESWEFKNDQEISRNITTKRTKTKEVTPYTSMNLSFVKDKK